MPSTWRAPLLAASLFLLVHLLDLVVLAWVAHHQARSGASPDPALYPALSGGGGLGGLLSSWDGQWYRRIAEQGYPSVLPMVDGHVAQNAWAFLPLYPVLVRLVMVTGLSFTVSGVLVNLGAATGATVVLHRLVTAHSSPADATWVAVGLVVAPASVIFCLTYSEGVALLVVSLVLRALQRGRYGWATAWTLVLGITRPIAPVVGLVVAAVGIARLRRRALPRREAGGLAVVGLASAVAFALWPVCAAVVTGRPDAYTATQARWLDDDAALITRTWVVGPLLGGVPVAALVLATVVLLGTAVGVHRTAARRAWPPVLRWWALGDLVFLAATTRVVPSILRYLLLGVLPWWPVPEVARAPVAVRRGLLAVAVTAALVAHAWYAWTFIRLDLRGIATYP